MRRYFRGVVALRPIVLGTTSRYKTDLFNRLGLPYHKAAPPFDEASIRGPEPRHLASALAKGKAYSLAEAFPKHLIIGSDQVLALGPRVFTKPGTVEKAVHQLSQLMGKTHSLHTAYTLLDTAQGTESCGLVTSKLTMFENLPPSFLRQLVISDQTWDCVGGYKFESKGVLLMKKVETEDPNAIVGLPLLQLVIELRQRGYFH